MPKLTQKEAEIIVAEFCKERNYTFKDFSYKDQYTRIALYCNKHNYEWFPTMKQIKSKSKGNQTKCVFCKNQNAIQPHKLTQDEAEYRLLVASDFMQKYIWEAFEHKNVNDNDVKCKCMRCGYEWSSKFGDLTRQRNNRDEYADCPKCVGSILLDDLEAQISVSSFCGKNNYSYKEFTYQNTVTQRIDLTCNTCGNEWNIDLNNIRRDKTRCRPCMFENNKLSQKQAEEKLNKISGNFYEPLKFIYDGHNTQITCICNCCHKTFTNTFRNLIYNGAKCPDCFSTFGISKAEYVIRYYIEENFPSLQVLTSKRIIPSPISKQKLEIDILLPDINLAIEYNGTYWHSDEKIIEKSKGYFKNADEYHQYKTDKCLEMGIDLIHIFEKDYMENRDIVLNKIKQEILKRL